jgi:hypothetical protein
MSRFAYLAYLALSASGMLVIGAWRGILDRRLLRTLLITVPVFLIFDAFGVARGWFYTEPSLNVWILPGGISIEEVINLAFLTVVAIELSLGFRRLRGSIAK